MKLLSERNQILEVAERWEKTYGKGTYLTDKRGRNVLAELKALDVNTATYEQVAEIVGNWSWVSKNRCDECGKVSWDIVQVGEKPDYESATACMCADCLRKALELVTP